MSRIKRFIIPFILLFAVSLMIGLIRHNYYIGPLTLIGYLPVTGPGNYFASMLLQFILIAPLIYYLYKKSPAFMLIVVMGIDLSFQLIAPHVQIFYSTPILYHYCILRYVSAIGLGFYISGQFIQNNKVDILDRKNWFLWALVPIAILYLSMVSLNNNQPFSLFMSNFGYQNIISFSWPLLLVILVLNIKLDKYAMSKWFIPISTIGKASYHIFLVQMIYYVLGISAIHYLKNTTMPGYLMAFLIDATVICIIGLAFYFVQAGIEHLLAMSKRNLIDVNRSI